jgi:predicted enzyme related to lactoylglutathione lyase
MPRPVHFEIFGNDPQKTADFYTAAFGWTVNRWGDEPYWLIGTGEGPGIDGGAGPAQAHGQTVVLTVGVEDLDASLGAVEKAGGTITTPKMPIPGIGWLLYARDPNGIVFGMMQADPSAKD